MRKKIYLMRPEVNSDELKLVKMVLASKTLTEGKITQKFERKVARYVHSKYAIATTSATTALHTSLVSIGVAGKKILVSDFTFPATAHAVTLAGGTPVLVDVDRNTMNVTSEIIENLIDSEINFVLPVSIFGNPLEKKFYQLKARGMKIIEDAATNLGTKVENKYVGSLADITCFSFHPRKIITTGEGGMITTNNKKLADQCASFKIFGKVKKEFTRFGTNYKLSDILSAVGLAQLQKIERIIRKRRMKAKIYNELLSKIDYVELQEPTLNSRHTYQSYVCCITKPNLRDKIRKELAQHNVETQIGTYALHCLPAFKNCLKKGNLSNSEYLYKNTISLPLHHELQTKDQEFICNTIRKMGSSQ